MQQYLLHLRFKTFPRIVTRNQHVLILLQNAQGEFILAQKKIYPKGISRMVGGGMEPDEKPASAAARELHEETGLQLRPNQLKPLAAVEAHLTDATDDQVTFTTYLYYYQLSDQTITPQDDVDKVVTLSEQDYFDLLHRYENLPSPIDEKLNFSWADYGQLYGFIHRLAINELRRL